MDCILINEIVLDECDEHVYEQVKSHLKTIEGFCARHNSYNCYLTWDSHCRKHNYSACRECLGLEEWSTRDNQIKKGSK